jgi:hypothetical protein
MKRVVAIAVLCLASVNAQAADDGAEGLIAKGVALRRQGRNTEALALFKQAHELAPTGRTLAQMGMAEQSLRAWTDSEDHLGQALESGDTWVEKNRVVLADMLSVVKSHVGTVELIGPVGVPVQLDGREVGRLPMSPLRRNEGPLRVEIGKGDHVWRTEVTVGGAQTARVEAPLEAPVEAIPQPDEPARTSTPISATDRAPSFNWTTAIGSGLVGAGVAGLTFGVVTLVRGSTGSCAPGAESCTPQTNAMPFGVATSTFGAAAVVTGAVLLIFDRREDRALSVAVNPRSVVLRGRF